MKRYQRVTSPRVKLTATCLVLDVWFWLYLCKAEVKLYILALCHLTEECTQAPTSWTAYLAAIVKRTYCLVKMQLHVFHKNRYKNNNTGVLTSFWNNWILKQASLVLPPANGSNYISLGNKVWYNSLPNLFSSCLVHSLRYTYSLFKLMGLHLAYIGCYCSPWKLQRLTAPNSLFPSFLGMFSPWIIETTELNVIIP